MALFKNEEQREVEVLNKIEKRIERREKRERLYKIIIGGLAVVAAASLDRKSTRLNSSHWS